MAEAVTPADRFGFTLFLALVFHGVLILGLGFAPEDPEPTNSSLDVTMATQPSREAPEEADFIADAAQQGSGELEERRQLTTTERASLPDTRMRSVTPPRSEPEAAEASSGTRTLTTTAETSKSVARETESRRFTETDSNPHESLMERSSDIASLEARLADQRNRYAKRPRINRVTSVSTMKEVGAAYVRRWQETIERTGNLNYPEQARRRGLHGDVRMMVSINSDGTLREMQVLQSSGHTILDDAARRIVRQASPFEPFDSEMIEQQDVLEIIRTWSFRRRGMAGTASGAG